MFFLLRMAFWFSIVLLFLPMWPNQQVDGQPVGAITALSAAQRAVSDIAGLCERQPDVCETGRQAAHTIGVRARESARIAYDMIEERADPGNESSGLISDFLSTPSDAPKPPPRPVL